MTNRPCADGVFGIPPHMGAVRPARLSWLVTDRPTVSNRPTARPTQPTVTNQHTAADGPTV